jgi:hypothetical protein
MSNKYVIKKIKLLKNLEAGGQPQDFWVKSNKEILLNQISPLAKAVKQENYYFRLVGDFFGRQVFRPALGAAVVIVGYFISISLMTVANASLPGDMLYPIKTASENVQMAMTFSDENKVNLQMDFISRRGDELQQIVRQPESAQVKMKKVETAVKKISKDVKEVNDKLTKIANTTSAKNAIEVVKQVDEKTLKVEGDLVSAHALLSNEVKKEVVTDIKEAIANTGDVGTRALTIMVEKGQSGEQTAVSDMDIASRVAERIKNAENGLAVAVADVQKAVTSTPVAASATSSPTTLSAITSSTISSVASGTTAADIAQKPVQAAAAIEEAKTLLEQKNFTSALEKIGESKALVGEVIEKTPTLTEAIDKNTLKVDNIVSSTIPAVTVTSTVTGTPAVK